jgi:D-beta-D-heptose 7-phosphate kinase/D-beta-D-heptose 1-phosphate adenosyltransferase
MLLDTFHDLSALCQHCDAWRQAGETLVFTNGCFDLFHAGHAVYLDEARALGDRLIVGINSDASVRRLKGNTRPIVPLTGRGLVLNAPIPIIQALKPDIHVKGGDYSDPTALPEYPIVSAYGGRVVLLSFLDGFSTSSIIQTIQHGPDRRDH